MPSKRTISQPSVLLFVTATILLAVPFHIRPDNFIVDDGYFYPEIARFIASGKGSTFNGIMPTNGFHPLWMLICVFGAFITRASGPLLQLLTAIQDLITLFSILLLRKIAGAANKRGILLGCAPILFFGMVLGIWRLLEANLSLLLQIGALILVVPILPGLHERLGRWRVPVAGIALGLAILARLDLVFFVGTLVIYELLHQDTALDRFSRLRNGVVECLIAGALVAPYLAWNLTYFHHLQPVSGAIKSTFPHIQHWQMSLYIYPVIAGILLNSLLLLKRERTSYDILCLLTAIAATLHLIYTLSFGGLAPWYLTTGYLNLSLGIIWIVDDALMRWPFLLGAEKIFALVLFCVYLLAASLRIFSNFTYTRLMDGDVSFRNTYKEPKLALAIKLRETLPPGSRIFVFDAPGGIAYASGMSILPADGLVADYNFDAELAKLGFSRYADEKHIDYFIAPYLQPGQVYDRMNLKETRTAMGQSMRIETPLTHVSAGSINLSDADLVFRAREVVPNFETSFPELGVWRIPHSSVSP